jgi:hypothetical protein
MRAYLSVCFLIQLWTEIIIIIIIIIDGINWPTLITC